MIFLHFVCTLPSKQFLPPEMPLVSALVYILRHFAWFYKAVPPAALLPVPIDADDLH